MMTDLSPRELELAKLVAAGYTNTEISLRVQIARQTVKNHLRSVFSKLQVTNRVQVALRLSQMHLTGTQIHVELLANEKSEGFEAERRNWPNEFSEVGPDLAPLRQSKRQEKTFERPAMK